MKVKLYYGKVNKYGIGDVDILLAKDVEIENVGKIINDNKQKMLKGWPYVEQGDFIQVVAENIEEDYIEVVDMFKAKE